MSEWISAREAGQRFGVPLRYLGMQAALDKIHRRSEPGYTGFKARWEYLEYEVRQVAKDYRSERGMAPMDCQPRECLRCGRTFPSQGVHNRLCPGCQGSRSTSGRVDEAWIYTDA